MTDPRVLHPNFRIGPGQKNIASRIRAVMFALPQEVYDVIMNEVDAGRAKDSREVIARAVEKYFDLPNGSASRLTSE